MSQVDEEALKNQAVDYVVTATKSVLGLIPVVGSALAEFAGTLIPNQRIDRLTKFATELSRRLSEAEGRLLTDALQDPTFGDLVEESMRQAANSLSDERRSYLAALVANSMDQEAVSATDSRHVLRLVGQLNDLEVILLRSYLVATLGGDEAFREKHAEVLEPVAAFLDSDQATLDKSTLRDGYPFHLNQLGLLRLGRQGGFDITPMGRLVLRMIGLTQDGFNPVPESA